MTNSQRAQVKLRRGNFQIASRKVRCRCGSLERLGPTSRAGIRRAVFRPGIFAVAVASLEGGDDGTPRFASGSNHLPAFV